MKNNNFKRLGKSKYLNSSISMSDEYKEIAANDEKAAYILYTSGLYNQSVYFYIQSMEKYIKSYICTKIDIMNPYYADKLRDMGHSLDAAIEFFIEIMTGNNPVLRSQMEQQMKQMIFQDIRFSKIHNSTRYPSYIKNRASYSATEMTKEDCERLQNIYANLKKYLYDAYLKL